MKVNYQNNRDISFNGFYNNKALKKGLEFAADNGTLFCATTTLALSAIRPLSILATPKTDKKNKQVASSKSIMSSVNGYIIALACSLPLSKAIKRIDKNPKKYLSQSTISNLKESGKTLAESKAYSMATQLFKLGLGFLIAAPKAVLTALGTPYILKLFDKKNPEQENFEIKGKNTNFKGKRDFSKKIGKIINNKKFQNFVKENKDSNFPLHIVAMTDTFSTSVFVQQTLINKKLKEKDKKPLVYNSIIATVLSITSTYLVDYLTKGQTDKFIQKFTEANKNDPKLAKYIEGIKIAKPMLIAGLLYYIAIPVISTFMADRVSLKNSIDKP